MPSTPSSSEVAQPGEPDDYLVGRVQQALADEVNELDVDVTIAGGGDIYLDGVVLTEARRDAVAAVVQGHVGGRPVHNQLIVAPLDEPTEAEEIT